MVLLWSWIGEGAFKCALNLSPNVLAVSPIYSSSHSNLSHLNLYVMPLVLLCGLYLLVPPVHLLGLATLEMSLNAISFANVLHALT